MRPQILIINMFILLQPNFPSIRSSIAFQGDSTAGHDVAELSVFRLIRTGGGFTEGGWVGGGLVL